MPLGNGGKKLVAEALRTLELPMVVDADGLNHLVGQVDVIAAARAPVVLTPHPGEAARLLGTTAAEVERARVPAVRRLAEMARAVVVLKGARTLVCDGRPDGDGLTTINPTGNPGLATAGTGDVLTGIIGALLAQGLPAPAAARLGVYVHGAAGDRVRDRIGPWGVVASDLVTEIAPAMNELSSQAVRFTRTLPVA
jgi:NAD(P)H-hydrate epimerase